MTENSLLNYRLQLPSQTTDRTLPTLVFLHGLFGDMNNLGMIARAYSDQFTTLRVDLRNHGHSFRDDQMDYESMAADLILLLEHLQLNNLILIGHSMGGKVAMRVATLIPQRIQKLIVLDMAPVAYGENHHDNVFKALFAVKAERPDSRQQAKPILQRTIQSEGVQQFLLKSFTPQNEQCFLFNLTALYNNYPHLIDWRTVYCEIPTLFIKGGQSDYILPQYKETILAQFPNASSFTINHSGHWLHSENPELVIKAINRFLGSPSNLSLI